MKLEWEHLSSLQLDALKEVVNIGAGNAATALSKLLKRSVTMEVPKAELIPVYEVAEKYGAPETPVCAVLIRCEGEFSGNVIFLMEEGEAFRLSEILISQDLGSLDDAMKEEIRDSVNAEVGNIIIGAFLSAISLLVGSPLPSTVPAVAHDMLGSIMDVVAALYGMTGDVALMSKTTLNVIGEDSEVRGTVLLVPDPDSLETLLKKLGVF
ncbi:MAG: chemotaxis protein CheC [Synergistota bacterium]|nr:chemotaxis protein CheC [Synergistota bacterium]